MSYLLVADDNEDMRLMLRDLFRASGHEVAVACDGLEVLAALKDREPDLVVLDNSMPNMTGLEVCRRIKENPFTARIPVLMLTAQSGVENKVEGFTAGADEYLAKPFDPRELRARVQALLRLVQREGDRNPTSQLPGGRAIDAEIMRRVDRGESFAVCYLDLDNFKPFADTFGFAIADEVIRGLGAAIRQVSTEVNGPANRDFVGHIGGDDFIIVTQRERARQFTEMCAVRCRDVVARAVGGDAAQRGTYMGPDRDGHQREFPLASVSAAVMSVTPENWVSLGNLGQRAAEAKRGAKQQGPGGLLFEED
ncbi:MAG: response regulator [Gemmatimonadetes bacterium]|nr:response regulator [Gemmatimonadota bacterium]